MGNRYIGPKGYKARPILNGLASRHSKLVATALSTDKLINIIKNFFLKICGILWLPPYLAMTPIDARAKLHSPSSVCSVSRFVFSDIMDNMNSAKTTEKCSTFYISVCSKIHSGWGSMCQVSC